MGKGLNNYFFDTYALHEMEEGSGNYLQFSKEVGIVTTTLNLMEPYYGYFVKKGMAAAELAFSHFRPFCVEVADEILKEAAAMRAQLKAKSNKSNLSYVDCIGYVLAKKFRVKFLTGDGEFEGLENVEFVK